MAGKYLPFARYLMAIPSQTQDITLSFPQIETILKFSLPASALQYQAWWSNERNPSQPQKLFWQAAGWQVDEVDLSRRQVRFHRSSPPFSQVKTEVKPLPIVEPDQIPKPAVSLPLKSIPDLSIHIYNPAWTPIFTIPQGAILQKGRHGLYSEITQARLQSIIDLVVIPGVVNLESTIVVLLPRIMHAVGGKAICKRGSITTFKIIGSEIQARRTPI
jgi:hypothetical protein